MAKKSYLKERNCSVLDAYTVKDLFRLVTDNPDLGFALKRVRRREGRQSWFYALDGYGRKSRISREEAAGLYVAFRMKQAEEANKLAWKNEWPEEFPRQKNAGEKSIEGSIGECFGESIENIEERVENEPAEEKLFEVYRRLGITQKRNGEGIVFIQDKQDGFRKSNGHNLPPAGGKSIFSIITTYVKGLVKSNGNNGIGDQDFSQNDSRAGSKQHKNQYNNPKPVSQEYVLDAVAAYAEYEPLIESSRFEDLNKAVELAQEYFPRLLVEEAQRKLFQVYGDGEEDPARLYELEAGIGPIDYRTNPFHASSDVERELEMERITRPLSAVEAAEFEREVRMEGLERLVRVEVKG